MAFPVPALQAVVLPPLVVELPEVVVGRVVVLDVVRLEVGLPVVDVLDGLADVEVDVDTAGAGVGLELHAPSPTTVARPAAAATPLHTPANQTVRIPPP